MSRGIPAVRAWRVRYWCGKVMVAKTVVDTINRDFADWMAFRKLGYPSCDRATISLVKGAPNAAR